MNTPSRRRRDGREAFHPGENPKEACPYSKTLWNYSYYYRDFLEGWEQAEAEWEKDQKEDDKDLADMVLEWWDENGHQEVETGDGDWDNLYEEEPDFVREAKKLKRR